jgi:16S rRNA G527 N7-methylase RsmG
MSSYIRLLDDWLAALVATPGLTGISDLAEARRMLEDSLRGQSRRRIRRAVVDVGSGGGVPGIRSLRLPGARWLLGDRRRWASCGWAQPNVRVVQGRAEEQETDVYEWLSQGAGETTRCS